MMGRDSEAWRIAHELEQRTVGGWLQGTGETMHGYGFVPDALCWKAAALLRGLEAEIDHLNCRNEKLQAEVERMKAALGADHA